MKKAQYRLHWTAWVWIIPMVFVLRALIDFVRGRDPLEVYKWVSQELKFAFNSVGEGNFEPLAIFILVGVAILLFANYWTNWEENRADEKIAKTELKQWALKKYISKHNLDNSE